MKHHRSVSLPSRYTAGNYQSRAHICAPLVSTYTHATVSLVAGPYRLIDGDSRVGNPIHRAEDKFHVPQCVSKWETQRVAVLVRLRLHRETMAPADLCTCVYVRMGRCTPPTLVSNCVHWDGWVQEIPCNSNSLNSYVVRLFLAVVPRTPLTLPSTCLFFVFYVNRVSILSRMHPSLMQFHSIQVITDASASGL